MDVRELKESLFATENTGEGHVLYWEAVFFGVWDKVPVLLPEHVLPSVEKSMLLQLYQYETMEEYSCKQLLLGSDNIIQVETNK